MRSTLSKHLAVVAQALVFVACKQEPEPDKSAAAQAPAAAPTPTPAAPSAAPGPAPTPPPAPAKPDPVNQESLSAGLAVMLPRLASQVDAYMKIQPDTRSRFFMHPDQKKSAVVEFDTKGLASLSLAPFINDFSADPGCVSNPEAGVVKLTWSVDGKKKGSLTVNRDYTGTFPVDVSKSSRLKLEVDAGNGVIWCDWFSV